MLLRNTHSHSNALVRLFVCCLGGSSQTEVKQGVARYGDGLATLKSTEDAVGGMQEELEALQPQLRAARAAAEAMVTQVGAKPQPAAASYVCSFIHLRNSTP